MPNISEHVRPAATGITVSTTPSHVEFMASLRERCKADGGSARRILHYGEPNNAT